mmetsp:Transcript_5463/g.7182  ORF Transcript_5463/g.7182 Transcript_5463/m.7182 type:complete len:564 (-) Transcript_5463:363-2054(-)
MMCLFWRMCTIFWKLSVKIFYLGSKGKTCYYVPYGHRASLMLCCSRLVGGMESDEEKKRGNPFSFFGRCWDIFNPKADKQQVDDAGALRALYAALGGDQWEEGKRWDLSGPLDELAGVTLDAEGRVAKLVLEGVGLKGRLPPALGALTHLTVLNLGDNRGLTGPLPPEIGELSQLLELNAFGCDLEGPLPATLSNLHSLSYLDHSDNPRLRGPLPPGIGELSQLQSLYAQQCDLEGPLPSTLGNLPVLLVLYIRDNPRLGGPIPTSLGLLPKLKVVDVSNTGLEGEVPATLLSKKGLKLEMAGTGLVSAVVSLEVPAFRFMVVPRDSLLKLNRFLPHEEVTDLLEELELRFGHNFERWYGKNEVEVLRRAIAFISHRWLTGNHPDDSLNSKLRHLQALAQKHPEWLYFWVDFFCVPQADVTKQQLAINSLPYYVNACGTFVTLCGEEGEATLSVYEGRGWCRLERLSALCPMRGCRRENYKDIPTKVCKKVLVANKDKHTVEELSLESLLENPDALDPMNGTFFDNSDKIKIQPAVDVMIQYMLDWDEPMEGLKEFAQSLKHG